METCIGFKLKMAPFMLVMNSLALFFAITIPRVIVGQHQPYFFNYQPQQQQQQPPYQQNTYQPFTNTPPANFYTPSFESHAPGGSPPPGPALLNNFFGNGFSPAPTAPASSSLIPYPTQVTTLDGARHHLMPQSYQPVENSLVQQAPTVPSSTTTNAFRPSPFLNHHTHIVNGLPRQQFFGNNYAFFRERHGLNLPATTGPFLHQNTIQNSLAPTAAAPSPTPVALVSSTQANIAASPSASPSKASESKPNLAVKTLALDLPSSPSPPTTQSTFLSRFPFNGPSTFSPVTYQQQQNYKPVAPATTPAPRIFPTAQAQPTTASITGVSPSFQFSQFFPETDSVNSNELARQPLFQGDEEEGEEDDSYTFNNNANSNNNNNNYYSNLQVTPQRPQQQFATSPPVTASPVPVFKSQQQASFNSGGTVNNNALSSQTKDEPAPIRVHNTQPIRIVFNYEQAVQALEESPGVSVVIAHTEKNNLTQDESSTTTRPYAPTSSPSDFTVTSPRPTSSPVNYQSPFLQSTTPRPFDYFGTYRPAVSTTYRPTVSSTTPRPTPPQRTLPPQPVSRFQYQPVNVPYNTQTSPDQGTTAAALENLALELEGRFVSTGRPNFISQQPVYETVATLATQPTTTEDSLQSYKRGSKKYVVIPKSGDKVYRAQEPRVVVNDLANILVQTVQPGGHYSATPPSTFPRQTFREYEQPIIDEVSEVGQQVDEDLSEEIAHLSQQIRQDFPTTPATTTTTTTTTTPTTRRPPVRSSPQPRVRPTITPRLLRITTYRPPFTFPSTYVTTTSPPPPPPPPPTTTTTPAPIEEEIEETLPEVYNQLSSDPPSLSPRKQPARYYYNDKSINGISGAHQRYEYNGVDEPTPVSPQQNEQQRPQKAIRRRPRPRGRLIAGSPPRSVQVNGGLHGPFGPGPVLGPNGLPPQLYGPGIPLTVGPGGPLPVGPGAPLAVGPNGPLGPVPPGAPLQGPVFRVGPRGRLLRRKSRPRAQLQGQQPSLAPSPSPSSISPSPSSPSILPPFSPIPQDVGIPVGPFSTQLPPLYSPTPFVPQEVPLVTTFRPGPPPNALLQQSLVDDEEERKSERPGTFRSRFRFAPTRPTSSSIEESDDGGTSSQYDSEEEAPVVLPKRRFSTTTSTTEKPAERAVVSDRANILQRQIRFNRNRKNQRNNKES